MGLGEVLKIARRNWLVKLICFVLAVFIYFFYRVNTLQERTLVVPLQVSAHGLMLPAENTPTHVKVSVRTRPQDLPRISEQSISAKLRLDYYTEPGEYEVPIEIELSPDIMGINPLEVSVDKGSVTLAVAPKARRQIPVTPSLQGTPAPGYEVVAVSVEPSTIEVFGVETLLDPMTAVFAQEVSVDGKLASFSQTVAIYTDNSLMTYEDTSVRVHVDIQPISMTRRIENQEIYLHGVNPLFVAHADPRMITFTLRGNQNQLGSFVLDSHSVRLDCSSITESGTYELPVEILLPSGISLISQTDRMVTVSMVPAETNQEETVLVEEMAGDGQAEGQLETAGENEAVLLEPNGSPEGEEGDQSL